MFPDEIIKLETYMYVYMFPAMKGLKVLGTILVNSSTNSNLKPRYLQENSKESYLNHIDTIYLY